MAAARTFPFGAAASLSPWRRTLLLALTINCSCLLGAAAASPAAALAMAGSLSPPRYDHLHVRLLYPEQGASTPETTLFRCMAHRQRQQLADDAELYYLESSACHLCLELDDRASPPFCWRPAIHELHHAGMIQEHTSAAWTLTAGNHSARCFVGCANGSGTVRIDSERVRFSVVTNTWWTASKAARERKSKREASDAPSLIVGVKTSLIRGLPLRQAIRETWASATSLPTDVRVVFLGCQAPLEAAFERDAARRTVAYAIELEQSTHGDLLIDELGDCEDSYEGLVDKVTAFLRYVSTHYTVATPAVMVADDDVYVDVRRLARLTREHLSDPHECVYAGQVWEEQFQRLVEPVRTRGSKYFVSEQDYPIRHWPPFAFGPHYLLSAHCLSLVLSNERLIGGFRGLDDISIAVWLLVSGVRPRHLPQFRNLRDSLCIDRDVISLADLSPTALRAIHHNLAIGRPFCHGSDLSVWLR